MSHIRYINLEKAKDIHEIIINESGGLKGYDPARIETLQATLEHIKNDDYYPTMMDKTAQLLFGVNKAHAF